MQGRNVKRTGVTLILTKTELSQ